jgi:hypothetical protein
MSSPRLERTPKKVGLALRAGLGFSAFATQTQGGSEVWRQDLQRSFPMSSKFFRRAVRWLLPATLLALTPKCLLCVLAYAGLGAALGLGSPEICGASIESPASWASSLAWLGVAGGLGTFGFLASCRRRGRSAPTGESNHG